MPSPMRAPFALFVASLVCLAPAAVRAQAAPPVQLLSSLAPTTAARRPVWSGLTEPARTVVLSLDGRILGSARADAHGRWVFASPLDLTAGAHHLGAWVSGTDPLGDNAVRRSFSVAGCTDASSCEGATPVCDADASLCRACRFDAECAGEGSRCALSGPTRGMCVAPPPVVTVPAAGSALDARGLVMGTAAPNASVAILVDGGEVARVLADERGTFAWSAAGLPRAWHEISAAVVESGLVGAPGPSNRAIVVECVDDAACGGRRCEPARFVCAR